MEKEFGPRYEWVLEMDEVNPEMPDADVCLVVGANDITNSAAQESEGCPIYGMPVVEVWKAKNCIYLKRTMAGGSSEAWVRSDGSSSPCTNTAVGQLPGEKAVIEYHGHSDKQTNIYRGNYSPRIAESMWYV